MKRRVNLIVLHNDLHIFLHSWEIFCNSKQFNYILFVNDSVVIPIVDLKGDPLCCFYIHIEDSLD